MLLSVLSAALCSVMLAQVQPGMADAFRSSGKIYVVVSVVSVILAGIILYLFLADRRLTRLEREVREKNNGSKG